MTTRLARLTAIAAAVVVVPVVGLLGASAAVAGPVGNCGDLDSGRTVVPGNQDTVTVTAPEGKLITGYCVKSAGLRGTTGAPLYVTLAEPQTSLVLHHPDGGNLTHYSLTYFGGTVIDPEDPTDPTDSDEPFDWNWTYAEPTCDALTVDYPSDLPSGQSNDVNIRLETNLGQVSLNYHNDETTWAGTTSFAYSQHSQWPAGITSYTVVWTQVGGTNYHWQGNVDCRTTDDGDEATYDAPVAVSSIDGFRSGAVTVLRGRAAGADAVSIDQIGTQRVALQRLTTAGWTSLRTVADAEGTTKITFPTQNRRGTYKYRLQVAGSQSVTGATTRELVVRVR